VTTAESTFNGPFVITGLSGAGKTLLSRSLEDIGYICVDNIPLELVPLLFARTEEEKDRLVVVLDVRTRGMIQLFPEFFRELRGTYPGVRLVFVEASPEILLRRFSVARRPHPLRELTLERAITEERSALAEFRELADLIIDTTNLSPHDLRRQVQTLGGDDDGRSRLTIEVQSFSYMQGVPATASLVFDVRFLPNPFFVQELRALSGNDDAVKTWLDAYPEVEEAVSRIMDLVSFLLPRYVKEMKTHLGIALGCTGGKHRSVYAAERVARELAGAGHEVVVHHRDKERWRYSS
jgi:RNase adapter protein RapZ